MFDYLHFTKKGYMKLLVELVEHEVISQVSQPFI